jgi:hypothetical protein
MKRALLILGILSALPSAALADGDKEELKKLFHAGLSEDVLLNYARSKGSAVKLSADDVIDLKKAGLSDGLLANILRLSEPDARPVPAAMQKLIAEGSIVFDGRYFYPRSYFTSGYSGYSSAAIGIGLTPVYLGPCGPRYGGYPRWSSYGGGYGYAFSGRGSRICNR